jgi:hypothetical protein
MEMNIDTEHLHYWIEAIRQSPDPMRTMDAFWRGQIKSKEWLITQLSHRITDPVTVDIFGGWNGVLASLLFQSGIPIKHINNYDIDPSCKPVSEIMNKIEEIAGKFKAHTSDMCDITSVADVIINTSCEHLTQEQYEKWLGGMSTGSIIILQSNNYDIPEHVRWHKSFEDFKTTCQLNFLWGGEMKMQLYTRYMIIGYKNV